MVSDNNCHRLPSALQLGHFVLTTLDPSLGFLSVEAVKFPIVLGLAGAQQSHAGMSLLEVHCPQGWEWKRLELPWNPRAQDGGFPGASLLQEPGQSSEKEQFVDKVYRGALWEAAIGGGG